MTKRVTIEALAGWLRDRDDIALMGHVNPDGDAVGSCLGLWHALRALGKRAVVVLPGGAPKLYRFLPGVGEVVTAGESLPFAPQTAFAVDVSDKSRLGDADIVLFDSCPHQAVMDHHPTNEGYGQVFVLDGEAAAVGELAVDLVEALGVSMTREMAECLFTAISTDCGQFNYSNTRPQTFTAAAKCATAGIDIERITSELYRTRTLGRTRLLGLALADLHISEDGRIAWTAITEDMLLKAGAIPEDNEGVVNYLLEIEGVQIAILANERGSQTKLSLRSTSHIDVAKLIAIPLGGGGHACAAGVTVEAPAEEALSLALSYAQGETLSPPEPPLCSGD